MINEAFSIRGKNVLITGASSGIGFQTALQCDLEGANLIACGRNLAALDNLFSQMTGDSHKKIVADLATEEGIRMVIENCGQLDGFVHCAGVVIPFPVQFLTRKKVEETFSVNYIAAVEITSLLLKRRKLNNGASVVFLSSVSSQHPFKGGALYSGSKSALEAFSRTVSIEFANKRIRANCISPAMVKTPIYDEMNKNVEKETVQEHLNKYPLGVGEPADVANAIIFLLSNASKWITGVNLVMDGGLSLER
jgi:NAD(P)-dependent dehydrogenase (short-subunit alcohol dehydrogenase family)